MKKFLFFLFVFYTSFINCHHQHESEEKKLFIEHALYELYEIYETVQEDCLEKKFSADLNFGVLFTDNFDNDLKNIEKNFSPSVIDYLKNHKDEKNLIVIDDKLDDDSYHKMVIVKIPQYNCLGIMVIEATLTGDIKERDSGNCPFIYAIEEMFNQIDFKELVNSNYLVYNFKYSQ